MKSRVASLLAVLLTLSVAACANTIRGAGQDIENTTEAVEDSAENIVD